MSLQDSNFNHTIYERRITILQHIDIDIIYKPAAEKCVLDVPSRNPDKSGLKSGINRQIFPDGQRKTNISQRSKRSEFAKFVKSPETNFINLKVFKCDIYFPHRKTCKRQKSSKESIPGDEITVVMSSSLSEVSLLNQLNKTTWVNSSNTMTQKDTYQATTEADFTQ